MNFSVNKSVLPPSELGNDRCFQIEYYGHGDIFAATWNGDISNNPTVTDETSTCFNFAHGSDVVIIASLAGYLRRVGQSREEVKRLLCEAGQEILDDDPSRIRFHSRLDDRYNAHIAEGRRIPRFDLTDPELHCLVATVPSQPGVVEKVGGTAIYTRPNPSGDYTYVLASINKSNGSDSNVPDRISHTADLCVADVPTVAGLVCQMAMGEYRLDIQAFLTNLYANPSE